MDTDFIPDDYVPPETNYDSFPDGKYHAKGIVWFSLDDNKKPILAFQKDGKLVGRLRFILTDGKEGPPMSVTLGEMALLAKVFKAKVSNPPPANHAGLVTQYMLELQDKLTGDIEIEVKGGWVNSIPGMEIPSGFYYFHTVDISGDNTGGQLKPKQGNFGPYFFITFEIDAGEGGSETPFKGAQFTELVQFGLQSREGSLDWERVPTKDASLGAWSAGGTRMSKLVRLTAPDIKIKELTLDSFMSAWRRQALEVKKVLKGTRMKEEKGNRIRLILNSLEEASGYRRVIEEMGVEGKIRQELVNVLDKIAGAQSTVNGTYELTAAGKEIAKKYLTPLKKEGQIKHGSLEELTPEEITIIMRSLQNQGLVDENVVSRVIALGVGFDEPLEEEDSPF